MTYNGLNRLSQSVDSGASGTRAVGYDTRGNVTSLGNLAFLYDYSDQPTIVTGSANGIGAANGNFTYDGNLKRVKSVINGKTTYNVYDASGALTFVDAVSDNKATNYITGPMGTLARVTNGTITYLHPDHQVQFSFPKNARGSAQSGTTLSGAVAWREQYTPFGEEIVSPAANDNLAGFTGHIRDKATGLNYMQARYYDPVIGRFLSVDSVTFMDTGEPNFFNRYAYAFNDPINMLDPDGRETVTSCEGVSATCNQGIGGQIFSGGTSAENLGAANMAAAKVNAELTGNSGNEWGTTFEGNGDGSVTASISYSNGSGGNVSSAAVEILQGTDNPVGDQHTHPGLPDPSYAYETMGPSGGDINSANKQASASGPFTITVVDGPSGDVVSRAGTPGTYNGDRRTKVLDTGVNRTIGNVGPIPYFKKD